MPTYHIAFKRTERSNHWVKAANPAEAEELAWRELDNETSYKFGKSEANFTDWLVECIDEEAV